MINNDYKDIFRRMEREMEQFTDEVFRGFFEGPTRSGRYWQPHVDVYERGDDIAVKVELPGVQPDAIDVSLSSDDRILTISGVRKEAETDREGRERCHQLEIYFGPFERRVAVPQHLQIDRDAVRAAYRDGFLLITLPKKAASPGDPKRIPIRDESLQENRSEAIGEING